MKKESMANAEISCANPLDMESWNTGSKILAVEDLQVQKVSIELMEDVKVNSEHCNNLQSRNKEKRLSRGNSSIWNFMSMDITHKSSSSIMTNDFDESIEKQGDQYCSSPVQKQK
jgi:hypothetical protein